MSGLRDFFDGCTPEEAEQAKSALDSIPLANYTMGRFDRFLSGRVQELDDEASDSERRTHYVLADPRYEIAIKDEYDALLMAVSALAKYFMAQEATESTWRIIDDEATSMLIAANKIHEAGIISADEINKEA